MKRILILIIGLIGVAYGQSSPTSAKTRFVNGLYLGTKLDSYFAAADSNAIYWRADSVVMAKYKGTARALAFASALGSYKLIADTFFTGGYTTRIRTKLIADSLASVFTTADALKKNIADTFFTTGYTTRGRTKQLSDSLAAVKYGGTVTTNTIPLASGSNTLANSAIVQTASGGRILLNGAVDNGTDGLRAAGAIATAATTASTSSTTGALRSAGGLGVAGTANIGGKVGIGEANSGTFDLEVVGNIPSRFISTSTATAPTFGGFQMYRRTSTVGNGVGISFGMHNASAANAETGYIGTIITTNTAGAERGDLVFYTTNNGSSRVERLRFIGSTGLTYFGGAVTSANRLTATSLIVNKDSIPRTTANAWVLTVDTTGTPSTNRVNRRNINEFYVGDATFDTTARTLTIPKAGGGSTSLVIPRGTASGASGITALSSSRTGNLVTVSGDNGSSTIFSVRDADSSAALESLTAGNGLTGSPYNGGSPLTWTVDTATISTKANVTGLLVGYATTADNALKLNISDTASMLSNRLKISDTLTMLSNRLRISDTLTMLSNRLKISDTSNMLSPYARTANIPSLTPYLLKADSLSGGYTTWLLTKKKIDSIGVLKVNYTDTAAIVANRLKISDTATMLLPFVHYSDTASIVSGYTRLTRFTDSLTNVQTRIQTKLAIADTASMLAGYTRLTRFTDSLTAVQARIQTKQPLGNYITLADSSTILAGRWLPNRSADSIAVIRALANTKLNISDTASMLANRLKISDTLSMLSPYARTANLPSLTPYLQKADSLSGGYTSWLLTKKKIDSLGAVISTADLLKKNANDSFFVSGFTTRGRTKQGLDSLGVLKVNYTDTASMLSNYRRSSTLILNSGLANSTISGVALGGSLNNHLNGYGISGTAYNGALTQTWIVDTSAISTKANVTGVLVAKLNISDTATMLSNYRRTSTLIQQSEVSGLSTSLAAKLNISDTATMLSGYKTYYPRTAISAGTGISYNAATGVITNSSPSSGGTVTSVATSAPITGGTITSTGTIGITQSTSIADGYLSSTDWNTFNNKASTASVALKLNISPVAFNASVIVAAPV